MGGHSALNHRRLSLAGLVDTVYAEEIEEQQVMNARRRARSFMTGGEFSYVGSSYVWIFSLASS